MPYKHTTKKIPRGLDRRVKLTDEDREQIRALKEDLSQRELARKFNVSRRLIVFTLYPDRYEIAKEQRSERGKEGRYYNKEDHREGIKKHRRYKQSLYLQGKLIDSETL